MERVSTISILSGTLGPHPADGISAKRLKQLKSLIAKHGLANSLRFIEDVNGISSANKSWRLLCLQSLKRKLSFSHFNY